MKELFITGRRLGPTDVMAHFVLPVASTPLSRVVLFSSRRQHYHVVLESRGVRPDPREGHDVLYKVDRTVRSAVMTADCGMAADEAGWEYDIKCNIELGFTIRDERDALERAIRNFDAEFESFKGLVQARMRSLVRIVIAGQHTMHAFLDADKCRLGLEQSAQAAGVVFEVAGVHRASFGDPEWKSHRARALHLQEVEAQAQLRKNLGSIQREETVMRAAQPLVELQRTCALKADEFRRLLDQAEAEHKIAKARLAYEQLGPEHAIAVIDPAAYALIASHRERMEEPVRELLAKHNADLVAILRKRLF